MSVKLKFLYENKNLGFDKVEDTITQHISKGYNFKVLIFLEFTKWLFFSSNPPPPNLWGKWLLSFNATIKGWHGWNKFGKRSLRGWVMSENNTAIRRGWQCSASTAGAQISGKQQR